MTSARRSRRRVAARARRRALRTSRARRALRVSRARFARRSNGAPLDGEEGNRSGARRRRAPHLDELASDGLDATRRAIQVAPERAREVLSVKYNTTTREASMSDETRRERAARVDGRDAILRGAEARREGAEAAVRPRRRNRASERTIGDAAHRHYRFLVSRYANASFAFALHGSPAASKHSTSSHTAASGTGPARSASAG